MGAQNGFLISPDPIEDLSAVDQPLDTHVIEELLDKARTIPARIEAMSIRDDLLKMPCFDMSPIAEVNDFRITERLFQIYAHFANAYVWCSQHEPSSFIPGSVAVPLVQLARMTARPPILPYASTALANFERIDPFAGYGVDNLRCIQKMIDIRDESWFHLIHVEIEAHAGGAVAALLEASRLMRLGDKVSLERELAKVPPAFDEMIHTFQRIGENCSTDVYYFTLRPDLFGFDDVIYEGVTEFEGKPMSFRGESGAQSSVIPAIREFLGLQHAEGGLSEHLTIMRDYMPKRHRKLIEGIERTAIRSFVETSGDASLRELYNLCLERLVESRSLHLKMARAFVAHKVTDPRGTGGTEFMKWLTILRDETAQQFLAG